MFGQKYPGGGGHLFLLGTPEAETALSLFLSRDPLYNSSILTLSREGCLRWSSLHLLASQPFRL